MEKILKIGIIGCGAIGKDHCRRIMDTVPGATVVAVSDYFAPAADETAAKYGIRSFGNDCDAMIKDPEVECVVITSIDPTHHDYVMKTLAEEKWCFCEKPLALTGKDCETIINRELEIGKRLVQVGFMRHYDRGYSEMKRIIDSGELGAPRSR
jgi:myo-inositol 2-dehydrogenase/D-chiro-inositol 1-dehydrogenase